MSQSFSSLSDVLDHGFDTVIDVRSPAEFAEDHIPGAISLPVLSNEERAEVGTMYTQISPFRARKMGAALVARNAAAHIEGPLADKDGAWRPLVYCWRGGQRSGSFTSILQQIGWRAEVVNGGYQTYRRLVKSALYDETVPHRLILLDGNTGTAKTDILHRVAALGGQVLDLEGLAAHRGSVLGAVTEDQPAQKGFESRIAEALHRLDPDCPVLVEAESNKVGERLVPPAIWSAMKAAPRVRIEAPVTARADYLARAYADMIDDPSAFAARIALLEPLRGRAVIAEWTALLEARDFTALAADLMERHYDPAYAKSRNAHDHDVIETISAQTLDEAARDRIARQVIVRLETG